MSRGGPLAKAKHKDLTIIHCSLEVFDTDAQAKHDVTELAKFGAHIVTGTESGDEHRQQIIRDVFETFGYHVFVPEGTDCWIAVRSRLIGHGWNHRYKKIFGSSAQMGRRGPFGEKGVVSVGFNTRTLGHVGIVVAHYLTQSAAEDADALNKKLAHACVEEMNRLSAGPAIAFFMADTNLVDKVRNVFYSDKHLTTCWDELRKWPDTGHGNIDVVASVDSDTRVECISAKVLDDKDLFMHTDHFVVVTKYRVQKL